MSSRDLLGADVDPAGLLVSALLHPPDEAAAPATGVENARALVRRQRARPYPVEDTRVGSEALEGELSLSRDDMTAVIGPVEPILVLSHCRGRDCAGDG